MWTYVLQRLLLMIPTLFGILLITFLVIQFVPGGPVEQMVAQFQGFEAGGAEGPGAAAGSGYRGRQGVDAARVEEIKKLYGFDKPPHERFIQMIGQFARFDLGRSFFQNKDVWSLIVEKLPSLYVYRLRMGAHVQTGVAGCFSLHEYDHHAIKKHELTRPDKEDDRTRGGGYLPW